VWFGDNCIGVIVIDGHGIFVSSVNGCGGLFEQLIVMLVCQVVKAVCVDHIAVPFLGTTSLMGISLLAVAVMLMHGLLMCRKRPV
jgi:hypothetical protein